MKTNKSLLWLAFEAELEKTAVMQAAEVAADLADVAGDAMAVAAAAATSSPRCASMQALPALARTRSRSLMIRLVYAGVDKVY